jgi:hypothetical protein
MEPRERVAGKGKAMSDAGNERVKSGSGWVDPQANYKVYAGEPYRGKPIQPREPSTNIQSLGDALPVEIERQVKMYHRFAGDPAGQIAADCILQNIRKACDAMIRRDLPEMINTYHTMRVTYYE